MIHWYINTSSNATQLTPSCAFFPLELTIPLPAFPSPRMHFSKSFISCPFPWYLWSSSCLYFCFKFDFSHFIYRRTFLYKCILNVVCFLPVPQGYPALSSPSCLLSFPRLGFTSVFPSFSHRWFYISMKNQGTTKEIKHDLSAPGWLNSLSMRVSIPSILLQTLLPCPPCRKQSHRVPAPCSLCPPCWTRGLVLCWATEKLLCLFFLSWTPTILPNLCFESITDPPLSYGLIAHSMLRIKLRPHCSCPRLSPFHGSISARGSPLCHGSAPDSRNYPGLLQFPNLSCQFTWELFPLFIHNTFQTNFFSSSSQFLLWTAENSHLISVWLGEYLKI